MKTIKKMVALCFTLILILSVTACENPGSLLIGSIMTDNGEAIFAYLKSLNVDKDAILTEHTDVAQTIENEYKVENLDSDHTYIYHFKKETTVNRLNSFPVKYNAGNKLYPGSILFANTKILHGNPDFLESSELPREDLNIKLISGSNSSSSTTIKSPDAEKVNSAIKDLESKIGNPEVSTTYAYAAAWSDEQIDTALGISNASTYFGLDYNSMLNGKKTQMLAVYDSTYYTVEAETDLVNQLYKNRVDVEALKKHGVNENNPALLEVSAVKYGKRYVVLMNTNYENAETVLTAWQRGLRADGISIDYSNRYIFDNTQYKVYELSNKGYDLVKETYNVNEVNNILNSTLNDVDMSSLVPLSYKAQFVTDETPAVGKLSADYYAVYLKTKGAAHVKIDGTSRYVVKQHLFYGRAIVGIDNNGVFKLGNWECIKDLTNGDYDFYVDAKYAEYGYAFDILAGTDWPYANIFWKQSDGYARDILIDIGGGDHTPTITIYVNSSEVFKDTNCSSHKNIFE